MRHVDLTGSQREALNAIAQAELPMRIGHDPGCISPNVAGVLSKRGLATINGGMSKRTISITDEGRAEAAVSGDVPTAPADVEAMAQALCESGLVTPPELGHPRFVDELAPAAAAHLRERARGLLKRYHELLRARRDGA